MDGEIENEIHHVHSVEQHDMTDVQMEPPDLRAERVRRDESQRSGNLTSSNLAQMLVARECGVEPVRAMAEAS